MCRDRPSYENPVVHHVDHLLSCQRVYSCIIDAENWDLPQRILLKILAIPEVSHLPLSQHIILDDAMAIETHSRSGGFVTSVDSKILSALAATNPWNNCPSAAGYRLANS